MKTVTHTANHTEGSGRHGRSLVNFSVKSVNHVFLDSGPPAVAVSARGIAGARPVADKRAGLTTVCY